MVAIAPALMTQAPPVTIRPLYDHLLVRRLVADDKTPGGLIIPDNAKEKPIEGIVVAVGAGALNRAGERIALEVRVGDHVLFSKYSGTEVKSLGEDHMVLREDDVLAVIELS